MLEEILDVRIRGLKLMKRFKRENGKERLVQRKRGAINCTFNEIACCA